MILLVLTMLADGPILDAAKFASEKKPCPLTDRTLGAVIAWNYHTAMSKDNTRHFLDNLIVEEGQFGSAGSWTLHRRYGLIHCWRDDPDGKLAYEQLRYEPFMPLRNPWLAKPNE